MRIGKTPAAKIRHRVRFAPDDIVQNPEPEILQNRADAKNVVVAADDPQPARRTQKAAAFAEPGAGKAVVFSKIGELVPIRFDPVDAAVVGPVQLSVELEIVG